MDQDTLASIASKPMTEPTPDDTAALWQSLSSEEGEVNDFPQNWLAIQCGLIRHVELASLIFKIGRQYKPVASWPALNNSALNSKAAEGVFAQVAEVALTQKNTAILPATESTSRVLAFPVHHDHEILAVVAIKVKSVDEAYLAFVVRQLQWGSAWLINHQLFLGQSFQRYKDGLGVAFKLTTLCLDYPHFTAAAYAVSTEWATQFQCDRVSLGFLVKGQMRLFAVSHNAHFDAKSNLVNTILAAMDEACDQKAIVRVPGGGALAITQAQRTLLTLESAGSVCTIPFLKQTEGGAEIAGAVTLEHSDPVFFNDDCVKQNEQIALLVGPLLDAKRLEDRWIGSKITDAFTQTCGKIFGGGHYSLKMTLALIGAMILLTCFVQSPYRVAADATIEGWTQRHISAPIDGYLLASFVKAGDLVQQGQPLFTLDNRDLLLEQIKWRNKEEQIQTQHVEALVKRNSAEAGVLQAQLQQARAQLALIDEQLLRTQATAPFDGIVVKGDLSQKNGAPVQRGETLLQIAPLDHYRIILEVSEHDIAQVNQGQTGVLKLKALSDTTFAFEVDTVTPVASSSEGKNSFRVEARLTTADQTALRPGMQGTGKVHVGQARLIWLWTHRLVEWLQLGAWSWWL